MNGLRQVRDVHEGWVRKQVPTLAEAGLVRAVEEQSHGEVVCLARPAVVDELLRLEQALELARNCVHIDARDEATEDNGETAR